MRVFPFVSGLAVACCLGCGQSVPDNGSLMTVPPPDQVRFVTTQIVSSTDTLHWKWSVIGGRNWETPAADGTKLRLIGGYPLNSPLRQGACHTWEVDLKARREDGKWVWNTELHGSNGKTARANGTAAEIKVAKAVSDTQRLPLERELARIDDSPLVWSIPR